MAISAVSSLIPLLVGVLLGTSICDANETLEERVQKLEMEVLNFKPEYRKLYSNVVNMEGRLRTMERTIAFSAYYSEAAASRTWSLLDKNTFVFDQTILNKGRAYNTNTGKFRAPVSGVYAFTWTLCADSRIWDGGYGEFGSELVVGSSVFGKLQVDTEKKDDDACSTGFVAVHVDAGQDVYLRNIYDHQGRILSKERETRSTFSGWLMFQWNGIRDHVVPSLFA